MKTVSCSVGDESEDYEITHKNVLEEHVSVNIPFQRLLSGLMPSYNGFVEGNETEQKIKLHTSVGKKNQWKRKPKPVRDNRGQIIPGLYE